MACFLIIIMTLSKLLILLVSCLLTSLVGEVKFSTKSDYYTIGLKDIGTITASASALFSSDGKKPEATVIAIDQAFGFIN